jgi:hypothetical protein
MPAHRPAVQGHRLPREPDGHSLGFISDYDRTDHGTAWLDRVTARHAYHVTARTLTAQSFHLAGETTNATAPSASYSAGSADLPLTAAPG